MIFLRRFCVVHMAVCCLFPRAVISASTGDPDAGWGTVKMQGSVIDTPCTIALDSLEQTVDMGSLPVADIIRDGRSKHKAFVINLVNCTLTHYGNKTPWTSFQITFDGRCDGDFFGIEGAASGIALRLTDAKGLTVIPGQALPLTDITPGRMQLNYTLALVANHETVKPGNYFSLIRFMFNYY